MIRKPCYIGYQKIGGGPIVLEGPFRNEELALKLRRRRRAELGCSVKLSEPFIAHSEIEALHRAMLLLGKAERASAVEECGIEECCERRRKLLANPQLCSSNLVSADYL